MARQGHLIVDIGTGNARVGVVSTDGERLSIKRENVHYITDENYEESIYFEPDELWSQTTSLSKDDLQRAGNIEIRAITACILREGIVVVDREGNSLLGMPNIDHRGRKWEKDLKDKALVYELSGRYPT